MSLAQNKALSLIGLATKAGKTVSGEFSAERAVKSGRACLVVVAETASGNTKKKFKDMCAYYKVPLCYFGEKEALGRAVGKEFRASLAIVDRGFAEAVRKCLAEQELSQDRGQEGFRERSYISNGR